jgi:hypothetical protein
MPTQFGRVEAINKNGVIREILKREEGEGKEREGEGIMLAWMSVCPPSFYCQLMGS